jgi:hypothetical protein
MMDTIFIFDLINSTRSMYSTKINMLIRNSILRSWSMLIAIINNNFILHASLFKRFMILVTSQVSTIIKKER